MLLKDSISSKRRLRAVCVGIILAMSPWRLLWLTVVRLQVLSDCNGLLNSSLRLQWFAPTAAVRFDCNGSLTPTASSLRLQVCSNCKCSLRLQRFTPTETVRSLRLQVLSDCKFAPIASVHSHCNSSLQLQRFTRSDCKFAPTGSSLQLQRFALTAMVRSNWKFAPARRLLKLEGYCDWKTGRSLRWEIVKIAMTWRSSENLLWLEVRWL